MLKGFLFLSLFLSFTNLFAANSLSYSGRLVLASGAPVNGPVNLRAELVYTNNTSTILCFQNLSSVALTKGVFHLKLDFDCTPSTLSQLLQNIPATHAVAIRIIDQSNAKTYPLQALHAIPLSIMAEQLPQMGASAGQALAWDGTKWAPTSVGTGNGTVMSVTAGTGLSGGTITTTGTIGIAAGGITSTELANNSVTATKINAGEITSSHISATANIPYSKLSIGAGEIPQDRINGLAGSMSALIEDVIADAVTGKAPSQNAVYDALNLKADRSNVAQNITAASVTGLTAPLVGSAAANRDYVDNSSATVDTRITNEVSTLNTSIGNKYDKTGGVITGDVTLNTQLLLKGGSNFVTVKANSGTANYVMTLPTSAGTNGYVLQTDGAGVLSWVNPSSVVTGSGTVNSASITDGSIVDADINASANIAQSKILNLTTDLANKQPLITAGTTAQYYRGDKTFVDFGTDVRGASLTGYTVGANTALAVGDTTLGAFGKLQGQINATNSVITSLTTTNVAEGTNLYFAEPRVLATDLLGFDNTLVGPIVATDSVLQAFGRTQKQINDINTSITGNQWSAGSGNVFRTSGNVGIGTATPSAKLDVAGNLALNAADYTWASTISLNNADAVAGKRALLTLPNLSNAAEVIVRGVRTTNDGANVFYGEFKVALTSGGTAFRVLEERVSNTMVSYVWYFDSGTSTPYLRFGQGGNSYLYSVKVTSNQANQPTISIDTGSIPPYTVINSQNAIKSSVNADMQFFTNGNEAARIDSSGNVGIGTNAPTQKLDVVGNVKATQFCLGADCKSAWPTGLASGNVTTNEILDGTIATADIADGAVSLVKLGGTRDGTKYLKGDNTWATFATDAINSVLSTFTVGTGTKPTVTNTDTVVGAFGKVQKTLNDINADYVSKTQNQTINGTLAINSMTGFITVPTPLLPNDAVNKSYVDGFGQWIKNASNIYFNTGNVGIGTNNPQANLHLQQSVDSTSGGVRISNVSGTATTSLFVDVDNRTHLGGTTASPNALVIDNASGFVGFNTLNPLSSLDLSSRTDAISLPKGTTGQQPGSPIAGMLRFNTTTSSLEVFDGVSWVASITGGTTVSPAGLVSPFSRSTCPAGWLEANGATVSRTTYAALFTAIGTTFGAGDGSTTFKLPDLRGEFIRGFDNGRGVDTGRVFGSAQKGTLAVGDDGNGVNSVSFAGTYATTAQADPIVPAQYPAIAASTSTAESPNYYTTASNGDYYGVMRPRNIAMVYCVSTATAPVTTVANSGTGTTNTVPVWTSSTALGDSPISVSGANVGVGTVTPTAKLHVNGDLKIGSTLVACSGADEGTLQYDSTLKVMKFCDGTNWKPTSKFTGTSCKDILQKGGDFGSGYYTIDPDGAGGSAAFKVYCDMETNGGGWTRCLDVRTSDFPTVSSTTWYKTSWTGTSGYVRDCSGLTGVTQSYVEANIDYSSADANTCKYKSNIVAVTGVYNISSNATRYTTADANSCGGVDIWFAPNDVSVATCWTERITGFWSNACGSEGVAYTNNGGFATKPADTGLIDSSGGRFLFQYWR